MNIAILGFGVVGSGVAEVISKNHDSILKNSNADLKLTRILDIRDFENNKYAPLMTKNFDDILSDDSIKIVVETMGGVNPAFEFVSKSLMKGKHVVTSNKELVATKGYELLEIARKNNVNFMFEASAWWQYSGSHPQGSHNFQPPHSTYPSACPDRGDVSPFSERFPRASLKTPDTCPP